MGHGIDDRRTGIARLADTPVRYPPDQLQRQVEQRLAEADADPIGLSQRAGQIGDDQGSEDGAGEDQASPPIVRRV